MIVVFQPHLYSRTKTFATEFAEALGLADEVVVLNVYGAREEPEPGVTGALIADQIREKRLRTSALEAPSIPELPQPPDPEPTEVETGVDPELLSGGGTDSDALGADESPSTSPGRMRSPEPSQLPYRPVSWLAEKPLVPV